MGKLRITAPFTVYRFAGTDEPLAKASVGVGVTVMTDATGVMDVEIKGETNATGNYAGVRDIDEDRVTLPVPGRAYAKKVGYSTAIVRSRWSTIPPAQGRSDEILMTQPRGFILYPPEG